MTRQALIAKFMNSMNIAASRPLACSITSNVKFQVAQTQPQQVSGRLGDAPVTALWLYTIGYLRYTRQKPRTQKSNPLPPTATEVRNVARSPSEFTLIFMFSRIFLYFSWL